MYKVCSLFAGVGGIDLGFEQTGKFKPYEQMNLTKMHYWHISLTFLHLFQT